MSAASPIIDPTSANGGFDVVAEAARIGREVAGPFADEVDREGRFPAEAIAALREAGVLGALVPKADGTPGVSITQMARAIEVLGGWCSTTGMIVAMHQIQVACLLLHERTPWLDSFLSDVVAPGGLLASATSEVGIGGDVRSSNCAIESTETGVRLTKDASVISYGEQCDAILATARRNPDASSHDQVLAVVMMRPGVLRRTADWDALGFRGTCSHGFRLEADMHAEQIIAVPFAEVFARTMLPASHVFWSSLWLGMSTAALRTARESVRVEARKSAGVTPASAHRLALAVSKLDTMRSLVRYSARDFEHRTAEPSRMDTLGFGIQINDLKLAASQAMVEIVHEAMLVCGMGGYRQNSKFSLGRVLRDSLGSLVMINNERLVAANAQSLLLSSGGIDEDV